MTKERKLVEEALDKAGFAEYAAQVAAEQKIDVTDVHEDLHEGNEAGTSLIENHKKGAELANNLKELFRSDAKGIVDFEDADFRSIDAYITEALVKNPETVQEMIENLEKVQKDQKEIEERQKKIDRLNSQREKKIKDYIRKEKREHEKALQSGETKKFMNQKAGFFSFFTGFWKEGSAKAQLENDIDRLELRGSEIAVVSGVTKEVDKEIAELEEQRQEFVNASSKIRAELLQGSEYAADVHLIAKVKAFQRLDDMLASTNKGMGDIDDHQKMLDAIKKRKDENTSFGYLEDDDMEAFQEQMNKEADDVVKKEIDDAIADIDLSANKQFGKLVNSLSKIINRDRLGSRTKDETAEFIIDTLQQKAEDLKTSEPARSLFVLCLMERVKHSTI